MDIDHLQKLGSEIDDQYAVMGQARGFKERIPLFYCGCLISDLGELTEQIMIKEKYRGSKDSGNLDKKISHELADCLWVVLMLAKHMHVDLEEAYARMIEDVKERQAAGTAG